MPSSYHITEPHPTVSSHYMHAGRGGAGNFAHIDPKTLTSGSDASGPASRTPLHSTKASPYHNQPYYASGRGGAGNMSGASGPQYEQRPMFSFDEELERQRRMMAKQAPIYHVGRGGAGNFAYESSRQKTRTESMSSSDSTGEQARAQHASRKGSEGVFGRIRGSFGSFSK